MVILEIILGLLGLFALVFFIFVFGAVAALVWVCQKIEEARGQLEMRKFIDFIKRD